MDLPLKIMEKLVCSQCNQELSAFPVHSYENGEIVCGRCPLIMDQKPSRDFSYETFAEYINFPCLYKKSGCIESLTPAELKLHEPNCLYRQWNCMDLSGNCKWQGRLDNIEDHYEENHQAFLLEEMQLIELKNPDGIWEENYILRAIKEAFLIQLKKTQENLYINVCLLGPNHAVKKYNYNFNIHGNMKEEQIEFPKTKVQHNPGGPSINLNEAYCIDVNVLSVFKSKRMELEVLITKDIKSLKEPNKLSSLNEYILKHIECPVCFEYMSAPIFQCANSHVICESCKTTSFRCPSCREPVGNIRNRVLEDITENILYNCRFEGCNCVYKFQEKKKHECSCEYSPYNCPFDECCFKSNYASMYNHLSSDHFDDFLQTNSINIYFDEQYEDMKVLKFGSCLFLITINLEDELTVGVTFFGPKELPNNYDFVFDMANEETGDRIYMKMPCSDMDEWIPDGPLHLSMDLIRRFKKDILATSNVFIVERSA